MNIMTKKKKYKFQVDLVLEELTAVPFVSAMLFCKVHLLEGGRFEQLSSRWVAQWWVSICMVSGRNADRCTGCWSPCNTMANHLFPPELAVKNSACTPFFNILYSIICTRMSQVKKKDADRVGMCRNKVNCHRLQNLQYLL